MIPLRFAVIGTGFWANYQIAAWKEIPGVELIAVYNRTRSKAESIAEKYNIPRVYDDIEDLLKNEQLDFVDIITDVDTHVSFATKAMEKGIGVICQKPMAPSLELANKLVKTSQEYKVPFFIQENFRWQAPIRALKKMLDEGHIGTAFKARVSFCSAFPVFDNQPFLAELDHFILTDIGSHVLDICRFLFGEAADLTCLTQRVHPKIKGEDVATVMMRMVSGLHLIAEMSYASILEKESFPQTLLQVEGENGSIILTNDYLLKLTTRKGTTETIIQPPAYSWADPDYAIVHASIVDCNRDILQGLMGRKSETTGEDNLETVRLVWACYDSAEKAKTIKIHA